MKIETKNLKQRIRVKFKKIRESLSQELIDKKSKLIWNYLENDKDYISSDIVMFYSSINNEVKTDLMIKETIKKGKKVVLPQTLPHAIIPRIIYDYPFSLSPGTFGILEPDDRFPIINKEDIDIVIVPGIVFSEKCMRLGYGKGYYDKFLYNYEGKKVGIAFFEQMVKNLPYSVYDVSLDKVITDKIIIKCNKN